MPNWAASFTEARAAVDGKVTGKSLQLFFVSAELVHLSPFSPPPSLSVCAHCLTELPFKAPTTRWLKKTNGCAPCTRLCLRARGSDTSRVARDISEK